MPSKSFKKSSTEKLREERGNRYGPIYHSHRTIGLAIQSVLESWLCVKLPDIPPRVVSLIMAAVKLSRMARPYKYDKDDRDDMVNYVDFADEMHEDNPDFDEDTHREPEWFVGGLEEDGFVNR